MTYAQGSDLRGMRGVCVVGVVFAYMGYRNFLTTLLTMLEKRGSRARRGTREVEAEAGKVRMLSQGAPPLRGQGPTASSVRGPGKEEAGVLVDGVTGGSDQAAVGKSKAA